MLFLYYIVERFLIFFIRYWGILSYRCRAEWSRIPINSSIFI